MSREANGELLSFEEQTMPKDKFPSIFSPQIEATVFIVLQIFFETRTVFKERGIFPNIP